LSDNIELVYNKSDQLIGQSIPTLRYNQNQVKEIAENLRNEKEMDNSSLSNDEASIYKSTLVATTPYYYTYNRTSAAANYAIAHYNSPNADYVDYTNSGGDCTNFASQILHEGGGLLTLIDSSATDDNPSWYYNKNSSGWLKSYSWINADKFFRLLRNYSTIDTTTVSSVSSLALGDIISYDHGTQGAGTQPDNEIDHNATITIILNQLNYKDYYVTYRTNNRKNVDWAYYMLNQPSNTITVAYYTHINDTQAF
jgi:hypothetical protein